MSLPATTSHITAEQDRVPIREKFAYGVRAFAQQLGTNGMKMFAFPAFGIILGLDPALIGVVFTIMSIYDGVVDPLIGWLSDNTRTRWGRRRPWIFLGAILGGVMFSLLWLADPAWSNAGKTAYFIVLAILFYTGFSMITVPTDALGYELTSDYSERTRLMTWFAVAAKITMLILPWMFAFTQAPIWRNETQGLQMVGLIFGVLFIATGILPSLLCRERNIRISAEEGKQSLGETLRMTLSNRTYLILCGVVLFCLLGGQAYWIFGTHLAIYYLFSGAKAQGGEFFGMVGTASAVVGLITLFIISRFFAGADKRRLALFAIGAALLVWTGAVFLITPSSPWLAAIPICANGIAVSTFWLLAGSMFADVADEDELVNGHRREGMLAAFASFLSKLAGTLGALIGGLLLSTSKFDATLSVQPPETLLTMKAIFIGFPLVGYAVAFFLMTRYPLTRERMLDIRAQLEKRRGRPLAIDNS